MDIDQLMGLRVVETGRGSSVGKVSGVLIDPGAKRVVALAVSPGGFMAHERYLQLSDMVSVEYDVITIPSEGLLVDRKEVRAAETTNHITGRRVITEDGRELGEVRGYSIDTRTGDIESIRLAASKNLLGSLGASAQDTYVISSDQIRVLGENVVVDNSVPAQLGISRAA